MVFKRRGRRKFFKRRGSFKRRRFSGRKLHKRIRRIERGIETKHNDIGGVNQSISGAGTVFSLGYPTRGTDDHNRVAAEIKLLSLDLRMEFQTPGAALTGDNYNKFRVILGRTKHPAGVGLPSVVEILDTGAAGATAMTAPRQWTERKHFRILMDKVFTTYNVQDNTGASLGWTIALTKKKHFKIRKIMQYNNSNTGNATDVETNLHWLLVISDSTAPTHPLFNFYAHWTFNDS